VIRQFNDHSPAVAYRVCNFVCDDKRDPEFVGHGRDDVVMQYGRLAVQYETPVLHGPGTEVWYCHVICSIHIESNQL